MGKAGSLGRLDTSKGVCKLANPGYLAVAIGPQGVQTDVEPGQPRLSQFGSNGREQRSVGRHGDLVNALNARNHSNQLNDAATNQRLSARKANLVHTKTRGRLDHLCHFLKRKHVGVGTARYAVFRHAVNATTIASVCDRKAQVAYVAAEGVFQNVTPLAA